MTIDLQNNDYQLTLNTRGAEITAFKNLVTGQDIIWTGDAAIWKFHAPILFPHCGKNKDGYTLIENNKYALRSHGFARDVEYEFVSKTENTVTFCLTGNAETKKLWPYDFKMQVTYTLRANGIGFNVTVFNTQKSPFLYSIGTHSAFCINSKNNYQLEFSKPVELERLLLTEGGLLQAMNGAPVSSPFDFERPGIIPVTKKGFGTGLLFKNQGLEWVGLRNLDNGKIVCVNTLNFPYFVLWQNSGLPHFVCIEPWQGLPDLEASTHLWQDKPGLIELKPGQSHMYDWSITVR